MSQTQANFHASQAQYNHVGAQLRELRQHYGLSVTQVSERLHIRAHYLEAIETGDLSGLPGKVYTQGYIHSYAEFLGLNPQETLEHYGMLERATTKPSFTVIEPTKQTGIPAWRWVVAGLFVLAVVYLLLQQLMTPAVTSLDSRVEPVPERLQTKAEQVWVLNERNRTCLNPAATTSRLPCYYTGDDRISGAFLRAPVRSIMELKP